MIFTENDFRSFVNKTRMRRNRYFKIFLEILQNKIKQDRWSNTNQFIDLGLDKTWKCFTTIEPSCLLSRARWMIRCVGTFLIPNERWADDLKDALPSPWLHVYGHGYLSLGGHERTRDFSRSGSSLSLSLFSLFYAKHSFCACNRRVRLMHRLRRTFLLSIRVM